jgi:SNF2 family DNA or RNA helicase
MLAMEMGTGKSRTAIDIIQNDEPGPVLVVCPKAVVATWPHEVAKHAAEPWPVLALRDGTVGKRAQDAAQWLSRHRGRRSMIVCNYDAIHRAPMISMVRAHQWAAIVCDESQRIKSAGGRQSRTLASVAHKARRRLCLTGTPIPHSPLDLYGQFRFQNPTILGTSYTRFRARYAVSHPQFPSQIRQWLRLDELAEIFDRHAYRVLARDVLDLPEKIDIVRPVTLGPRARRMYESMRDEFVAEIETAGGPEAITASNALVKLMRLQQITGGALPHPESGESTIIDSAKQESLIELCEDHEPNTLLTVARELTEAGVRETYRVIEAQDAGLEQFAIHGSLDE